MASLLVGTFNTPELFHLHFDAKQEKLTLCQSFSALGNHSWLALTKERGAAPQVSARKTSGKQPREIVPRDTVRCPLTRNLYATAWTEPPSVAAYRIEYDGTEKASKAPKLSVALLNTAPTQARSGYVAVRQKKDEAGPDILYSASGPSGEVFALEPTTGAFAKGSEDAVLQRLDFLKGKIATVGKEKEDPRAIKGSEAPSDIMDFGGLRHGGHSIDLSCDGRIAYVADIGRNCIWVYSVEPETGHLRLAQKKVSPRSNDGPRHVWPHPNGQVVYVLQEHSCTVDVFAIHQGLQDAEGKAINPIAASSDVAAQTMEVSLRWRQGVRIVPENQSLSLFWADEVRTTPGPHPTHLLASTRGLEKQTLGYLALFALDEDGLIHGVPCAADTTSQQDSGTPAAWIDLWQTPTSGGWANAVEPCPRLLARPSGSKAMYAALTDSDEGLVMVLRIEADRIVEVARVTLGKDDAGTIRGAATAVWL